MENLLMLDEEKNVFWKMKCKLYTYVCMYLMYAYADVTELPNQNVKTQSNQSLSSKLFKIEGWYWNEK